MSNKYSNVLQYLYKCAKTIIIGLANFGNPR